MKKREIKLSALTKRKLWLAPLAGFTDNAFRTICKENCADVIVSEMVSADGLIYNFQKSIRYARFHEQQRPFGIQLFGSEPEIMKEGVKLILPLKPDFIDVNMGCPVKKVVKRGAGSALMKTPEVAEAIIREMKKVLIDTDILLSVKIRAGWDKFSINALEFAQRMVDAGADMICLHPRTRSEMFSGKSDWTLIAKLKDKLSIPVIGNGDITDIQSALRMLEETNCDSIMLGRGALGKPWIFKQIKNSLNQQEFSEPSPKEKLAIIKHHFELLQKEIGYDLAIVKMRSHLSYYTKGMREGANARNFINRCFDFDDICAKLSELFDSQ